MLLQSSRYRNLSGNFLEVSSLYIPSKTKNGFSGAFIYERVSYYFWVRSGMSTSSLVRRTIEQSIGFIIQNVRAIWRNIGLICGGHFCTFIVVEQELCQIITPVSSLCQRIRKILVVRTRATQYSLGISQNIQIRVNVIRFYNTDMIYVEVY